MKYHSLALLIIVFTVACVSIATSVPHITDTRVSGEIDLNGLLRPVSAPSSGLTQPAPDRIEPVFAVQQQETSDNTTFTRGLMHFTTEQLEEKELIRAGLPRAASYQEEPLPKASRSLLSAVPYIGSDRDQGTCGNCWVWAGTGALEIEHQMDKSIKDRISVQYFNSNWKNGAATGNACKGGWPYQVADLYSSTLKKVIPWSNTNAGYADGTWISGPSKMPASSIGTTPSYPLTQVTDITLNTHNGQSSAINTIKKQINANKPVMWGFYLPSNGWNNFFSFWSNQPESAVWNPDTYNGGTITGGHEVLIIGYDDTGTTPYWLVLNSWGTTNSRPSGLFRLKMKMNYDGLMNQGGYSYYTHDFDIFNTEFTGPTPTPTVTPTGTPTPVPGTGTLTVRSKPSGASIWIDGSNTGKNTTASISSLPAGSHTLLLIKNGYSDYSRKVRINSGKTTSVYGVLTQSSGKLRITSNPGGAAIILDGIKTGYLTPKNIVGISAGNHTIILKKTYYQDWSKEVPVQAGTTKQVSATLVATSGSVTISSRPSGAGITIDGINTTYVTPHGFSSITPGKHSILLSKSGYSDWIKTVSIKAGQQSKVYAVLKK